MYIIRSYTDIHVKYIIFLDDFETLFLHDLGEKMKNTLS